MAEGAGATHLGAVLVHGSTREVNPAQAREIAGSVRVPLVAVTANLSPNEAGRLAEESGARVIQLHGDELEGEVEELRDLGDWELWKAVRVRSGVDIVTAMERFGGLVDLLLLDGWHPRKLGGTGTTFPWEALEAVRDRASGTVRFGVAGGLSPDNVAAAVHRLAPDMVDVSSGVEAGPGVKDPLLVRTFVERALRATQAQARPNPASGRGSD